MDDLCHVEDCELNDADLDAVAGGANDPGPCGPGPYSAAGVWNAFCYAAGVPEATMPLK